MPTTLEEAIAKITELEGTVTTLTTENAGLKTTVAEKDSKIVTLEKNAKKQGENFKKLRDMTKEEKELLSEKELEVLKRQEEVESIASKNAEEIANFRKEQREGVVKGLINKFARGDEELAKKIAFNLSKIKDSELAMNEEALTPLVQDSFNMLGSQVIDQVRQAHNQGGAGADYKAGETDFAETEKGKGLSEALFGPERTEGGTQ